MVKTKGPRKGSTFACLSGVAYGGDWSDDLSGAAFGEGQKLKTNLSADFADYAEVAGYAGRGKGRKPETGGQMSEEPPRRS